MHSLFIPTAVPWTRRPLAPGFVRSRFSLDTPIVEPAGGWGGGTGKESVKILASYCGSCLDEVDSMQELGVHCDFSRPASVPVLAYLLIILHRMYQTRLCLAAAAASNGNRVKGKSQQTIGGAKACEVT